MILSNNTAIKRFSDQLDGFIPYFALFNHAIMEIKH